MGVRDRFGKWLASRAVSYWEGMASGAAVLTTSYASGDREAILPNLSAWAQQENSQSSVVFAAIVTRIMLLSQGTFQWQAKDDKHLFGNIDLLILEEPWGDGEGSTAELLARMEQDVSLAGNAYIWKVPDQDMLVRLRPDWITIVSEMVRVPGGGSYRRKLGYYLKPPSAIDGDRQGEFYPADEVAHWAPIPDPQATFRGMSWLTPAYRDIKGDDGLGTYKIRYLENAASPNLLIRYTQKLQPGTIDSVRERMHARYGGADNAFKTLVLDQGADATVIGNSLQQMDFSGVASIGQDRILADSLVPGVLCGLEPLRGAGRGYAESMQKFGNIYGRPQWKSVANALKKIVPPPPGNRLAVDTSDIAALQDGEMEKGQTALVRSQAILTLRQAGSTFDSAVTAVTSMDFTKLQENPLAALPVNQQAGNVQHLLPQPGQPGATAEPLPAGTRPRLTGGPVSPGTGGQNTRPVPQLAAGRRALTAGMNGDG